MLASSLGLAWGAIVDKIVGVLRFASATAVHGLDEAGNVDQVVVEPNNRTGQSGREGLLTVRGGTDHPRGVEDRLHCV